MTGTAESARLATPQLAGRLRRKLYAFSFLDEFGPFFTLYTLWFLDSGVTVAQTSVAFAVWAAVPIVLEVPSGALADATDRRSLIAAALVLRAIGIGVWLLWPSYAGVLIGVMLWATHMSLASGAWEALVYDELDDRGQSDDYARVMARISQFSNAGALCATGGAMLLLHYGAQLVLLGWLTVVSQLPAVALMLTLPRAPVAVAPEAGDEGAAEDDDNSPLSFSSWWGTLRDGIHAARHSPLIARLLAIGALLEGLFVVDEYLPILASQRGAETHWVPLTVLVLWLFVFLGGELAARWTQAAPSSLALLLAGATALILGALLSPHWLGLTAIGVAYLGLQTVWVISDARMQHQIPRKVRATVTSLRAFFAASVSALAFALVGLLSRQDDPSLGLGMMSVVFLVVAVMIYRWLPKHGATD